MVRKERSAGFVVFTEREDGKRLYLLLHYPSGHWDFPKGHVEEGESEIRAALRELREETGLTDVEVVFGFRDVDLLLHIASGPLNMIYVNRS